MKIFEYRSNTNIGNVLTFIQVRVQEALPLSSPMTFALLGPGYIHCVENIRLLLRQIVQLTLHCDHL